MRDNGSQGVANGDKDKGNEETKTKERFESDPQRK